MANSSANLTDNFASEIFHFSSQYGSESGISYTGNILSGISYTVCNILGPPTLYPSYGDFSQACVFRTYGDWWNICPSGVSKIPRRPPSFISDDFIELGFDRAVIPKRVDIYETYNPGTVVKISAFNGGSGTDVDSAEPGEWVTLWEGLPERLPPLARIFSPSLKRVHFKTSLLRVEFCHALCDYYTELDAISLIGRNGASTHSIGQRSTPANLIGQETGATNSIGQTNAFAEHSNSLDTSSNNDSINESFDGGNSNSNNSNIVVNILRCFNCDKNKACLKTQSTNREDIIHTPELSDKCATNVDTTTTSENDNQNNVTDKPSSDHTNKISIECSDNNANQKPGLFGFSANKDALKNGICLAERMSTLQVNMDCVECTQANLHQGIQTLSLLKPRTCHFDLLPDEVIQLILNYLDHTSLCRLAQTCSLLRNHCYDPLQYTKLNLKPHWARITYETLQSLVERCTKLQHLDLSWHWSSDTTKSLMSIFFIEFLQSCGGGLTCLRLEASSLVTDEVVQSLPALCPKLQELNLSSCRITAISWMSVAKLSEIRHLNVSGSNVSADSLYNIFMGCSQLEHLNIGSCAAFISSVDPLLVLQRVTSSHRSKLRSINVWRCSSVSNEGIIAIADCCPQLEELELGWCPQLTSACYEHLIAKCKRLKKFFLTANRMVSNSEMYNIAENCKEMEQLDILGTRSVTYPAVLTVLENCKRLRFFDLSFCASITLTNIEELRQRYPNVDFKFSFQT